MQFGKQPASAWPAAAMFLLWTKFITDDHHLSNNTRTGNHWFANHAEPNCYMLQKP